MGKIIDEMMRQLHKDEPKKNTIIPYYDSFGILVNVTSEARMTTALIFSSTRVTYESTTPRRR